jgi:hypothetical protein
MGNTLAGRGIANATNRLLVQQTYADNSAISNTKLKAFSKFLSALSMLNIVLAEVAGTDQVLTASDLVSNPTACKAAGSGACVGNADCDQPASSPVDLSNGTDPTNMDSANGWNGTASLKQFIKAAEIADTEVATFTGSTSNSGIFSAIDSLSGLGAFAEPCIRQSLLTTLGL